MCFSSSSFHVIPEFSRRADHIGEAHSARTVCVYDEHRRQVCREIIDKNDSLAIGRKRKVYAPVTNKAQFCYQFAVRAIRSDSINRALALSGGGENQLSAIRSEDWTAFIA